MLKPLELNCNQLVLDQVTQACKGASGGTNFPLAAFLF